MDIEKTGGLIMSKFKVGEIVVITKAINTENQHLVGADAVILSEAVSFSGRQAYEVMVDGHINHSITSLRGEWSCYEYQLRKKKPPQETSTWEAVQEITNWNPKRGLNHA